MSRIINNYKIQSTATATTTTTTTSTRGQVQAGTDGDRDRDREGDSKHLQCYLSLCLFHCLCFSVCPTAFRPAKGCKKEGKGGVLSCCNIFMAGMEYLNSYNFRIAQRAAMQRGHRSLQALRECGESRERVVVVVGLI